MRYFDSCCFSIHEIFLGFIGFHFIFFEKCARSFWIIYPSCLYNKKTLNIVDSSRKWWSNLFSILSIQQVISLLLDLYFVFILFVTFWLFGFIWWFIVVVFRHETSHVSCHVISCHFIFMVTNLSCGIIRLIFKMLFTTRIF